MTTRFAITATTISARIGSSDHMVILDPVLAESAGASGATQRDGARRRQTSARRVASGSPTGTSA